MNPSPSDDQGCSVLSSVFQRLNGNADTDLNEVGQAKNSSVFVF